jgi:hypothetical protein
MIGVQDVVLFCGAKGEPVLAEKGMAKRRYPSGGFLSLLELVSVIKAWDGYVTKERRRVSERPSNNEVLTNMNQVQTYDL